jgi:hypothetical protein
MACYSFRMGRLLLGILKGGAIGALLGWAALKVGVAGGFGAGVTYAAIGALVGLVCGKPIWRQETIWTSILKGLFGLGAAIGLYVLSRKLLGGVHVDFAASLGAPADRPLVDIPLLLGPLVGAVPGIFFEIDDAVGATPAKAVPSAPEKKK